MNLPGCSAPRVTDSDVIDKTVLHSPTCAISPIFVMMSQLALPPSFGIPYLIPTSEHQSPAGPRIENPASLLDHDFNFQIVVFKVYFLSYLMMKKRSQLLFKRSRIHSFRFLGMASTFREPLSRRCLRYRRPNRITLKAAAFKIRSIC